MKEQEYWARKMVHCALFNSEYPDVLLEQFLEYVRAIRGEIAIELAEMDIEGNLEKHAVPGQPIDTRAILVSVSNWIEELS